MTAPEEMSVEEGYTLWAPLYDDDGNPLTALEGPWIAARLGDVAGRPALDLGCGTGRHTLMLAEAGAKVVAADMTEAMLDRARAKLAGRPVEWRRVALPGPLPFPAGSFALVVMGLVAEHLEDLDATLAEVARVLEPGGRLLLSALHPDRTREGQRARFIDPDTGERRPILTVHREIREYVASAERSDLATVEEETLVADAALARRLPRAVPYVGRPLGWAAEFARG